LAEWRVGGVAKPTTNQLRALQASADAKAAQVAADAKAQAATIDNADVRLRAVVIELCAELEKIKTAIRTLHPATSNAIPARTAAEWGASLKAKAQELQQ
jgi:acetolactate synthase small subunit